MSVICPKSRTPLSFCDARFSSLTFAEIIGDTELKLLPEALSAVRLGKHPARSPTLPLYELFEMSSDLMLLSAAVPCLMYTQISVAISPDNLLPERLMELMLGNASRACGNVPVSPCDDRSIPTTEPFSVSTPWNEETEVLPFEMSQGFSQPCSTSSVCRAFSRFHSLAVNRLMLNEPKWKWLAR